MPHAPISRRGSSEELAQNGRATRGCCGRVSEMFGAAIGGLAPHTFKFGNFLATAVMVGVAAESVLQKIVEAVTHALDTTTEKSHFDAALKNSTTPLPTEFDEVLFLHVQGVFHI